MANPITIITLTATLSEIPDFPSLESPNFEAEVKATCDGIDQMGDEINNQFKSQLNTIISQINQNIEWMNENLAVFVQVGNDITKIITVADNIAKVITVADNINNVLTVANNIDNVNSVGSNADKVTTVANNIQPILNLDAIKNKIVSLDDVKDDIVTLGDNINKIVIVSDNVNAISTVANAIDNVNLLAPQATAIENISNSLQELLDVANNIDNVINAKNETLFARDEAITAKNEAVTAKDTAVTAKNIVTDAVMYKGIWQSGTSYAKDEIVRHIDKFYVSLIDNNTDEPPSDNWAELSSGGANLPDKTGKAGYFLAVTEDENDVEWKSLILPKPTAQTSWNIDEETTLNIPITNYNADYTYVVEAEIGSAFVNSSGEIVYSPGNVPETKAYFVKVKATMRGFFDSDYLTINVTVNNLQLPTPQLSTIDRISHLEQAIFDILNFDASYTYNIENEQNGSVSVDMQNAKIIFTPTLQTTTPVQGGFDVYVSKEGETPSDPLTVTFEIYIPKLENPVISGPTSGDWNKPLIFTIENYDSGNSYVAQNVVGGNISISNNQITFNANPTDTQTMGSFEIKATRAHYLDSDAVLKSFTITVPKLEAPVLSGPSSANEDTTLVITIENYDSNNSYIISKGNLVNNTIEIVLPNVDQDTQDSVTVKATRANYQDSDEVIFNYTILNVPIVADNAVQIVDFDALSSSQDAEIQNGDIVATADNASASVMSPEQEAGETDWVKYRNIVKYLPPEINLANETSNTEIVTDDEILGNKSIYIITSSNDSIETSANFEQGGFSIVDNVDPFGDGSGIALWQFDGNANDAGGNYNGTDILITGYVAGRFGDAVEFDGSANQHIDFVPINISSMIYTISCWVYRDNAGTAARVGIVQQDNANYTNILAIAPASGDVCVGDGIVATDAVPASQWCHVVVVYRVNGCDLYVDNVKLLDNVSVANNYDDLYSIGNRRQYSSDFVWKGLIDQTRIFNRALTAEEVQILYNEEIQKYKADISSLNLSSPPTKVFLNEFPSFTTKTNAEEIAQTLDSRSWDGSAYTDTYLSVQPTDTFRQIEYKWSNMSKNTKILEIHTDLWKEG